MRRWGGVKGVGIEEVAIGEVVDRRMNGITYSRISCSKLLLRRNDSTTPLSSVERTLASNSGLASSPSTAGLATNRSVGIPVIHDWRVKRALSDWLFWGR